MEVSATSGVCAILVPFGHCHRTALMTVSFFLTLGLLQRFDLSYLYPFQVERDFHHADSRGSAEGKS